LLWRAPCLLLATLLVVLATPQALHAREGDQVHFGRSIDVGEDESAGSLVCIACSIRVEGSCQDVVAIGGSIAVDGAVKGDVAAVGGSIILDDNASVSGDVVAVGGRVSRHPTATVKGEINQESGVFLFVGIFLVPLIPLALIVALVVWLVRRNRSTAPARV
jgi:hypothetical protein